MRILALADDMTGALEAGAKFRGAGIDTVVLAKLAAAGEAAAVVFDTETRHASPQTAAAEMKRFAADRPSLIYKKTDSTLRGNIAAELRALAELYPDWRIGYAPAYPALGRTVRNGRLYVDGAPVEQTAFGRDALNPIRSGSIAAMLGPGLPCTIFDGETDADLEAAVCAILADPAMRIAAGPAALAEVLARRIELPRTAPEAMPAVRSCLVMNGSRHECSAAQMSGATGPGWSVLRREYGPCADSMEVARENGRFVVEQINAQDPDAVFLIGGDTAFAAIAALGFPALAPVGEVAPGVPVTRAKLAGRRDLLLITKAGGFGGVELIREVRDRLRAV